MARDVNWWLMSLAFLLGLLLTLALTIRKVTREVPVSRTVEVPKPHLDKPALGKVAGAAAALHGTKQTIQITGINQTTYICIHVYTYIHVHHIIQVW